MTRKLAALIAALVLSLTSGASALAIGSAGAPDAAQRAVPAAPASPVDESKVPHYFGPYPNWANSPLTLPDAIVTISPAGAPAVFQTVGNSPIARQYASDDTVGGAGSGTPGQGTVLVIVPGGLPDGTLANFQTYTQNLPALGSPGNTFNAYVLHPTGNLNEYSIVFDSGPLIVPAEGDGIHTWLVSAMPASTGSTTVAQGDVIGFYGQGIPLDVVGSDLVAYPVAAAPTSPFVTDTLPQIAGRTYSFGATIQLPSGTAAGAGATAEATVGANGAITGLTITNPGHDYTAATVAITGAGTLAQASADVQTSGVVTSVAVDVAGGGYSAPSIAFSGGGASTQATGHALGGVDAVTLSVTGDGYSFPTIDFDMPDDPSGVQAQGHAVCGAPYPDCNRGTDTATMTIVGVVVDNPGSGYATAPAVVIRDGTVFEPINPPANFVEAKGEATLDVQSVVLDTFGAGYTSTPTVTIADTGSGTNAHAVAATDVGAVVALHLLAAGSGYVTPGGIKKFVDTLPGLTEAGANNLGQYIPLAVPDQATFPGNDYYVIAVVQHREQMSSSLPVSGTLLREYVQLETTANAAVSKHVALVQDNLDGTTSPIMMPDGVTQAVGVDDPHYLGPTIVASKDHAVRIVFYNLLPKGDKGDLFLPTDTTIMGSGMTPASTDPVPGNPPSVLDDVRNPMCTEKYYDPAMRDMCFTENRATLHLHGGTTPWISDGTPHQWITPANESTPWPQGVAVQNVPDMVGAGAPLGVPDCNAVNDGCQTFYYTNEQSARLMFYHDHAWGITRLNVYAGEAAGYVLTDQTEQKLISATGPMAGLGLGTPLVIQERTFVPSTAQLAGQDPTWDSAKWGGMGDLWYHHVYMPAQNPGDPSGMSAYGRWMYGPWFWPPATPVNGPIDNPYYNMDPNATPPFSKPLTDSGLHDGLGNLKPCNLDDPTTWQYQVDPFCEPQQIPGTPNISVGMEQFNDTPIVNGTAYPTTTVDAKSYRFRILNAANDRFWNLSWYVADSTGTEVALKASEVAAAQTDINIVPTPDTALSPAGPSWIQIGSEGGFLPAPTVVPPQPTTWITDPTRFDVGNVDKHSLLLAPAERGDVIVDFSKYAGKTLILYNDAPAAFPARVASYDYYTGGPDTGAGVVLPGYGPNTRTVMQVKVAGTPAPAFNLTALNNAFKHNVNGTGVFESSQDPIIVGQAGYNSAYGKTFVTSGDCTNPAGTNKCDGMARINQQGGMQFRFDNLKGSNPQLKVSIEPKALHDEMNSAAFDEFGRMTANLGLEAVPATPAGQNILLYPYIAPPTEVIDGTNLPTGDIRVQAISDGSDGTQIWKITHNGVDTHPIHFHLFNVQVLNRVTWDNILIPTEPSELGWKETVRISPLEDTIVAIRAIVPTVPFEIPNSIRPLSPMAPLGAQLDPTGAIVDPDGTARGVINALVNFGWEYVYHCHILSHEEMDMMRPVLLALPPLKADTLAFDRATKTLTWNDNSITETSFVVQRAPNGTTTWTDVGTILSPLDQPNIHQSRSMVDPTHDPNAAYQYRVIANNTVGSGGAYPVTTVQSVSDPITVAIATTTSVTSDVNPSSVGETVTFTATVSPAAATGSVEFFDGVTSLGTGTLAGGVATFATAALTVGSHDITATYGGDASFAGSTGSLTQVVGLGTTSTIVTSSLNPSAFGTSVTFTATVSVLSGVGTPSGSVEFFDGATSLGTGTLAGGVATFATAALTVGSHDITATYGGDASFAGSTGSLTQVVGLGTTSTIVTSSLNPSAFGTSVTFTATVSVLSGVGTPSGSVEFFDGATSLGTGTLAGGVATFATAALTAGSHDITATYGGDASFAGSTGTMTQVVDPIPAAPSNLVATAISSTQINLAWTDNATNETGFTIQRATNSAFTNGLNTITLNAANQTFFTNTGRAPSTTYWYRVRTFNAFGFSAWSNVASAFTAVAGSPAAPSNLAATAFSTTQINLAWTDNATNETGFTIQRSTSPDFTGVTTITLNAVDQVAYGNTGRAPNTTYYYRVRAFNAAGPSAWSNTAFAKTFALAPPAAPSNLVAMAFSPNQINLTWADNATNETGFTIQRSANANFTGTTTITLNAVDQVSYSNTGRAPNTTYYYRVRAFNADGFSAWSNTASATTPTAIPAVPVGLTVTTPATAGTLDISWSYTSNGAPGPITFTVQRSNTGAGGWTTVASGLAASSFTNAGLPANATRYYRVRAVNAAGNSAWTTPVSGTTLP